jgi:hypothetical protein
MDGDVHHSCAQDDVSFNGFLLSSPLALVVNAPFQSNSRFFSVKPVSVTGAPLDRSLSAHGVVRIAGQRTDPVLRGSWI